MKTVSINGYEFKVFAQSATKLEVILNSSEEMDMFNEALDSSSRINYCTVIFEDGDIERDLTGNLVRASKLMDSNETYGKHIRVKLTFDCNIKEVE